MLPGSALQLIVNAAVAVPPAVTGTMCEAPPLTVQFVGTSVSATVWLAAESPVYVVVPPLAGMVRLRPPSTVAVYVVGGARAGGGGGAGGRRGSCRGPGGRGPGRGGGGLWGGPRRSPCSSWARR